MANTTLNIRDDKTAVMVALKATDTGAGDSYAVPSSIVIIIQNGVK